MNLQSHSHRRLNALTGEWVLVSPHRAQRPWQGQVERPATSNLPAYDPDCYLCPGNSRAGGHRNPDYTDTFVFDNDFPALSRDAPAEEESGGNLMRAHAESGVCRVVCFSPRHDLTLARMAVDQIARVIDVWVGQSAELGSLPDIGYVQVFENRGEMMGCSNPHPHCQIWATSGLPNEPSKELTSQARYYRQHKRLLLADYRDLELEAESRLVCENDHFVAVVPFWAVWPFETLLLPRRDVAAFEEFSAAEKTSMAQILKQLTSRYDNLFHTPFPYSMGFHVRPCDGAMHREWQFHAHFYPPLLRSAAIRKFLVGFEMLAMPQRDLTPEAAAKLLS